MITKTETVESPASKTSFFNDQGEVRGVRYELRNGEVKEHGDCRNQNQKIMAVEQPTQEQLNTLNPGIRSTVKKLREWGFNTTDSGDGQTHEFECDRGYPYVVIVLEPSMLIEESHRLMTLLEGDQVRFDDPPHGQIDPEGWANYPRIESFYMPLSRTAIIEISNVMLPNPAQNQ